MINVLKGLIELQEQLDLFGNKENISHYFDAPLSHLISKGIPTKEEDYILDEERLQPIIKNTLKSLEKKYSDLVSKKNDFEKRVKTINDQLEKQSSYNESMINKNEDIRIMKDEISSKLEKIRSLKKENNEIIENINICIKEIYTSTKEKEEKEKQVKEKELEKEDIQNKVVQIEQKIREYKSEYGKRYRLEENQRNFNCYNKMEEVSSMTNDTIIEMSETNNFPSTSEPMILDSNEYVFEDLKTGSMYPITLDGDTTLDNAKILMIGNIGKEFSFLDDGDPISKKQETIKKLQEIAIRNIVYIKSK